ncbi:hypothetical protein [Caballeronia sp. LZ019]|uniref:hypothetical protein n=1 Tax=Caballeronia sp. LZ019 TaxID=3038555 RepID=UPI00285F860F|nr:hypothetical protein [Caballeronia sp. LZ019]MDR5810388.1 hypothetical protein [Caballeronia sp. LZ019]
MTRFAHIARRRFGQVSSTIARASRQFVPSKLNAWKVALYLIVFLLPGGSFAVLAMGWFENRHKRKRAAAASQARMLPSSSAPCAGSCGATGR